MIREFQTLLGDWNPWDTWIVVTAMVVAMSCTLPGLWLVLRQQSMMGDALSHTTLPGIIGAFLLAHLAEEGGWLPEGLASGAQPVLLAVGAIAIGVLTALLSEWIQTVGQVESSAALGVVYTSLFALGLLLVRMFADDIHLDADCVLFGQLQLTFLDQIDVAGVPLPRALVTNGTLLLLNALLLGLFYKELTLATFDPELAQTLGINARVMHFVLMGITAVTIVMAFKTVGSILVIGLLIVPAATALLLTTRLQRAILLSLSVAGLSAAGGHVLAKTLPAMVFSRLGFAQITDAGTAGMIAVACGLMFVAAFFLSPHGGILAKSADRFRLVLKIAKDDVLSTMYRFEEQRPDTDVRIADVRRETPWIGLTSWRLAIWKLSRQQFITFLDASRETLRLTPEGRDAAVALVRSHRLWESYMQKHFELPDDHLHASAHYVEHYLDQEMQQQLEEELDSPARDPHGREIPGGS